MCNLCFDQGEKLRIGEKNGIENKQNETVESIIRPYDLLGINLILLNSRILALRMSPRAKCTR